MPIINRSSCYVQAQWEWNDNAGSGRWSNEFQAYRPRVDIPEESASYGYAVITSRSKFRGKGRAISIKFRTEPAKDCKLLGWNMEIRGNKEP